MRVCAELLQQEEQKRQEVLAAQVNGKSEELELTQQMLSELLCQEDEVRLAIRLVPPPFSLTSCVFSALRSHPYSRLPCSCLERHTSSFL